MKKYNILIVEDEFINAQFIEIAVIKLGHNVIHAVETGEEAINVIKEENIHIVFMDINLESGMDGIQCAKIINQTKEIPIIYTTAFSDSQTINEATDTNLFGYLVKPYDYHDIEAVLNLTIKQNYEKNKKTLNEKAKLFVELNDEYKYYPQSKTLIKKNVPINLTKKESEVFYHLFKSINQNVSLDCLYSNVWENKNVSTSTVRDTILRLRRKIPELNIRTISGIGYNLEYK